MTKLSISEVSKRWGVSRPTLYRYKDQGKLSFEKDGKNVVIDMSEVIRVLGQPVSQGVKADSNETVHSVTSPDNVLKQKIDSLEREVELLKESLTHSRKSEDELRGIVDRQTRLLEDRRSHPGLLSRLFGRR